MVTLAECAARSASPSRPSRDVRGAKARLRRPAQMGRARRSTAAIEVDQFDDEHATYLIVPDEDGGHAGSARLLQTTRPHILDTPFPELCAAPPPRGPRRARDHALLPRPRQRGAEAGSRPATCWSPAWSDYALENGIRTYTGVAEMGWLQQILAFGWRCRPLGLPRIIDGRMLGALRIDISRRDAGAARSERHLPVRAAAAARAPRSGLKGGRS